MTDLFSRTPADPPIDFTVTNPRILVHYNFAAGEQPENVAGDPDGHLIVTLALARQVVRLSPQGDQQLLATLPAPADGGANVPVTGKALTTGVIRTADGTIYVGYVTGDAGLTGIWRIAPDQAPERITALPADSFPNGMAVDEHSGALYIADPVRGAIWRAPLGGGKAEVWSSGPELASIEFTGPGFGVNGLKVHDGSVWVSNTGQKTLLRYPIGHHDLPGPVETVASGRHLDDFIFIGERNVVLAAGNVDSELVLIQPGGSFRTLLTAADGLQNATSVLALSARIYVLSGAYVTQEDPNILVADLDRTYS